MRFVSFRKDNIESIGVFDPFSETITDFSRIAGDLPTTMIDLIKMGQSGLRLVEEIRETADDSSKIRLTDVNLRAPIPEPRRNVMAVGRNYHDHAEEFHNSGFDATSGTNPIPDHPIIFTKATTSVSGPFDPIPSYLDYSMSTDYEGELAVIIGKEGRNITKTDALDYVYGYTVSNDLTARTLQHQHKQWFIGKSLDGYCPMGPVLLTSDESGHPDSFYLQTRVNGEIRQKASCSALIFDIPTLIETISSGTTMLPGDIIVTGTPVGVGIGFDPPVFLKKGDVVEVTIDPIGSIRNKME